MNSGRSFVAIAVFVASGAGGSIAAAQTRTPWEMHNGLEVTSTNPLGLIAFTCSPVIHGDVCEYDVATIPPAADPGWSPAPNPDTIGFSVYPSRVCSAPVSCLAYGDFTYFQTFVNVPGDVVVTTFTIAFSGMDDGSRVTLFNSVYPSGLVIPGSYVFLGGSGTADLASFVRSGEINRVVVTQVDDCCIQNNLHSALVVLNGEVVVPGCREAADCVDGDACTNDVCNPDGTCSHPTLSCDDDNACTTDTCDPAAGCSHTEVQCSDGDACTTSSCDPATGCASSPVSCDDANPCTLDSCDALTGCAHVNQCPDCSAVAATVPVIWPPNHKWVAVGVRGVSDPQGQNTTVAIDAIRQDEPTNTDGDGDTCPDGRGVGTAQAEVRAERSGTASVPGDGRVYHIDFTARDSDGYLCRGSVAVCVPHDLGGGNVCEDQGPLYDSRVCE